MKPLSRSLRTILALWLVWAIALISFQALATARFDARAPDRVLSWTPADSGRKSPVDEPTLAEPFLNNQVAYDSEYYLSIATVGYDDPLPGLMPRPGGGPAIPLNYAFFPLYPLVMRVLAVPLGVFGLNTIATATLAGVALSLVGALAAMLALYDLGRNHLGESGAVRAAFYLLIFPTGFFLAQVYTEGVFLALAFWCLALVQRKRLAWAALLAVLAVWTRGIGLALVLPLAWGWAASLRTRPGLASTEPPAPAWRRWAEFGWVLLPVVAYALWHFSPNGEAFALLEEHYFGRRLLWLDASVQSWITDWGLLFGANRQTAVYFGLEFAAVALALAACALTARRFPEVALFSLAALLVPLTSGSLQSMQRYVLALPAIFLALGRLGRNHVFDRSWSFMSTLLMGLLALLYAFDFWTA